MEGPAGAVVEECGDLVEVGPLLARYWRRRPLVLNRGLGGGVMGGMSGVSTVGR